MVHSSSKYINGGGNSISGIIVDSGKFKWDIKRYPSFEPYAKFGPFAFMSKLRNGLWRNTGGCLSPFNAYMNIVGLETLGLRMERCCNNALKLAEFFESLDNIEVNYPALPSSPYYELTQSELSGKGGAIVTIRAGSKEKAFKLMDSIEFGREI